MLQTCTPPTSPGSLRPTAATGSCSSATTGKSVIHKSVSESASPAGPDINARRITPSEVASVVNSMPTQFLLLDIRPFAHFSASHVKCSVNLNCPELMLRRLSKRPANRMSLLEKMITDKVGRERFRDRLCSGGLILYDSCAKELDQATVLRTLISFLQEDSLPVFWLHGGFAEFSSLYPSLCLAGEKPSNPSGGSPGSRCVSAPASAALPPSTPMLVHSVLSCPAVQILPYLWLGAVSHCKDPALLKDLGITHVLNLAKECGDAKPPSNVHYMFVPLNDSMHQDIRMFLDELFAYIDEARNAPNGRILVHCRGGISRSVAVVLGYLMRSYAYTMEKAYAFVRAKKPLIAPNLNFVAQLHAYDQRLRQERGEIMEGGTVEAGDIRSSEMDVSEESLDAMEVFATPERSSSYDTDSMTDSSQYASTVSGDSSQTSSIDLDSSSAAPLRAAIAKGSVIEGPVVAMHLMQGASNKPPPRHDDVGCESTDMLNECFTL